MQGTPFLLVSVVPDLVHRQAAPAERAPRYRRDAMAPGERHVRKAKQKRARESVGWPALVPGRGHAAAPPYTVEGRGDAVSLFSAANSSHV